MFTKFEKLSSGYRYSSFVQPTFIPHTLGENSSVSATNEIPTILECNNFSIKILLMKW